MLLAKYVIDTAKIEGKKITRLLHEKYIDIIQVYVTVYYSVRCVGGITVKKSPENPLTSLII